MFANEEAVLIQEYIELMNVLKYSAQSVRKILLLLPSMADEDIYVLLHHAGSS
jgi:hypothetical protein